MKLRNKIFASLSLSIISVGTPIIVSSCSCSDSYTIKYGDKINCDSTKKDDKEVKYHSTKDVANASKTHVLPPEEGKYPPENLWGDGSDVHQNFYWDLVFACSNSGIEFTLNWKFREGTYNKGVDGGNFKGIDFTKLDYTFVQDEGKTTGAWYICADGTNNFVKSYTYSLTNTNRPAEE